jgi:hypothetical protein
MVLLNNVKTWLVQDRNFTNKHRQKMTVLIANICFRKRWKLRIRDLCLLTGV